MTTKIFYLDDSKSESITVSWQHGYKDFTITKDNETIGHIESAKALKAGNTFTLPDGRVLSVKQTRKWVLISELEILFDGKPIPGSGTDPNTQLNTSFQIMLSIAILNIIMGILPQFISIGILQKLGAGTPTIVLGSVFLILALLVKYRRFATIALGIAILMMALAIVLINTMDGKISLITIGFSLGQIPPIVLLANGLQASMKTKK